MKNQNTDLIGTKFLSLIRTYKRISRGKNRKGKNPLTPDSFLHRMNNILKNDIQDALNFIRMSLSTMKKSILKKLGSRITDLLSHKPPNFPYAQWYTVALDLIDCRLFAIPVEKPKRKKVKNSLHINFSTKNIELVNLPSILRQKDVQESLPSIAKSPYASINMPTNMFYSSISAEVLRIGRISSNFDNFISSVEPVIVRALKQGAHVKGLEKSLKKFIGDMKF